MRSRVDLLFWKFMFSRLILVLRFRRLRDLTKKLPDLNTSSRTLLSSLIGFERLYIKIWNKMKQDETNTRSELFFVLISTDRTVPSSSMGFGLGVGTSMRCDTPKSIRIFFFFWAKRNAMCLFPSKYVSCWNTYVSFRVPIFVRRSSPWKRPRLTSIGWELTRSLWRHIGDPGSNLCRNTPQQGKRQLKGRLDEIEEWKRESTKPSASTVGHCHCFDVLSCSFPFLAMFATSNKWLVARSF